VTLQIADSISLIRHSLKENHPHAEIKSGESGECDYRISSIGASISVKSYNNNDMTEEDINQILVQSGKKLNKRVLKFREDMGSSNTVWFEIHKSG